MGALDLGAVQNTICFGDYELDLKAGVLRKKGIRLRCQEQPLQVLAALAERPGEVLTREDLRRRVWPQDTFVDFDHALNTAIKKVRAVLNDDADAPRYIETVPRRGYRFVAQVEHQGLPTVAVAPAARVFPRWLLPIVGATILLLALLGGLWKLAPWKGAAAPTPEYQRLTFDEPDLGFARFTPDGASVVYCAGSPVKAMNLYTQRLDTSIAQRMGISGKLLAVSPQNELAVLEDDELQFSPHGMSTGTLARVPAGGAPRELLRQVQSADWSPGGQLAVVRRISYKTRLEFPVGNVLYETSGWISSPRFSPNGDAIAFLDHPITMEDRGSVAMVNLAGKKTVLSTFWESLQGLAWNPQGDEVWFTATRSGVARQLYAISLNGLERRVLNVAGGVSLQDISRQGRVLLSRDNLRSGILYVRAGETEPRELSWKDFSMVADITPDGKRILFSEQGENSGISYMVGVRPTDGSAPVLLGPGFGESVSPDGKWALSIMPPPGDQLVLLPIGAGSAKTLERGSIEHYQHTKAKWFPDGEQVIFVGSGGSGEPRCYVQRIAGGQPQAIALDGVNVCSVSPTGEILALTADARAFLYSSAASQKPLKEFKLNEGELPVAWTADGSSLYMVDTEKTPATITRYEVASGRRLPWKQLIPPSSAEIKAEAVAITPDGQSYAYTFSHHSADLYLVSGLK